MKKIITMFVISALAILASAGETEKIRECTDKKMSERNAFERLADKVATEAARRAAIESECREKVMERERNPRPEPRPAPSREPREVREPRTRN